MKILVIGKGKMGNLIYNTLKEHYNNDKKVVIDNLSLDKDSFVKKEYDYLIDFSHPDSINYYKNFLSQRTKIIIGTTNFSEQQEEYLLFLSKMNPIVKDSNFSKGLSMLRDFLNLYNKLIKDYHVKIIETHHKSKIDKPSGTTKSLSEIIRVDDIVSIRNDDLSSSHLIKLSNEFESIDINHIVYDKQIFVLGILESINFLYKQKNGLFTYKDVIEWM